MGNNTIIPRKPWMNQNILNLIKIINSLTETNYEEYKKVKNKITIECRITKDKWLEMNCKETEADLMRNNYCINNYTIILANKLIFFK